MKPSQYEHQLEDWACARFAEHGFVPLKFVSPGFPGVPDRIMLGPFGSCVFIEFKAPGQRPRRAQPRVIQMFKDMGHNVEVVDTRAQVETLLARFRKVSV